MFKISPKGQANVNGPVGSLLSSTLWKARNTYIITGELIASDIFSHIPSRKKIIYMQIVLRTGYVNSYCCEYILHSHVCKVSLPHNIVSHI